MKKKRKKSKKNCSSRHDENCMKIKKLRFFGEHFLLSAKNTTYKSKNVLHFKVMYSIFQTKSFVWECFCFTNSETGGPASCSIKPLTQDYLQVFLSLQSYITVLSCFKSLIFFFLLKSELFSKKSLVGSWMALMRLRTDIAILVQIIIVIITYGYIFMLIRQLFSQ